MNYAMVVLSFSILLFLILLADATPRDGRAERRAENELCTRLAEQVGRDELGLADYLATRCPALFITEASAPD